jgi:hypothetical protein
LPGNGRLKSSRQREADGELEQQGAAGEEQPETQRVLKCGVAEHLAIVAKTNEGSIVGQEGGDGHIEEAHAQVREDRVDRGQRNVDQRGDDSVLARPVRAGWQARAG